MTVRTKDDVLHSSAGPSQPFCPQMPLRQNPVGSGAAALRAQASLRSRLPALARPRLIM